MQPFVKGVLIDTGPFILDERGKFDVWALVGETPGVQHAMSAITAAELLIGVEKAAGTRHFAKKRRIIEEYLSLFPIFGFDVSCARCWAEITADLERRGQIIGGHDLLIAATAMRHGYAVATFNVGEFSRVPDLVTIPLR